MAKKVLGSVGNRAILFVLAVIVILIAGSLVFSVTHVSTLSDENAERVHDQVLSSSKKQLRNITTLPYEVAKLYAKGDKNVDILKSALDVVTSQIRTVLADDALDEAGKQSRIIEIVSRARYQGGENYVWINDRDKFVWHPKPELIGMALTNDALKTSDGVPFLKKGVEQALASEDKTALIEYLWPMKGYDTPQPKFSFMVYIPEKDWFVGSGISMAALVEIQKQKALHAIKGMRLPDGNYFWINDTTLPIPNMIMHPTSPQLDGKPLDNPKYDCATSMQAGIDGKIVKTDGKANLFGAMAEVARQAGEGYVAYDWPKPLKDGGVSKEPKPKLSYVKLFKEWGWVIGHGVYIDDIDTIVAENKAEFDAAAGRMTRDTIIFGIVFLILASALMWWFFRRSIGRPLSLLAGFAGKVAEGDLDARVEGHFPCETGELKQAIESMIDSLKHSIAEAHQKSEEAERESALAREATAKAEEATRLAERARAEGLNEAADRLTDLINDLTGASGELSGLVGQATQGSEMQRSRTTETATAMEEMNATVLEVARNAADASTSSDAAREKASQGETIVASVIQSTTEVAERSEQLKESLAELGQHAEGIGQIMNVITDIADQTNLLALNAAIEAARAGEAGRGFAVVADEVRKLAEKTMAATKEVGDAVSQIQNSSRRNIEEMDVSAEAVGRSSELAGEAGEALREIVSIVDSTSDQIRSIATASEEQSASSEEINRAMEDINNVSEETAQGMERAEQAIGELVGLTHRLEQLIETLRHNDSGNELEYETRAALPE